MDLTSVLLATQNPDQSVRQAAEKHLQTVEQSNLPQFLVSLVTELASNEKPAVARQAAGLVLKNVLDSRDETRRQQLQQQWQALDVAAKQHIKTSIMSALGTTEKSPRQTASQVLAKIAAIELPLGQWPDLIQTLLANVTSGSNILAKEASLEALGYICEDTDPKALESQANAILTAVIQGMRKEETSTAIRYVATKALYNSLEFIRGNFENQVERDFIMTVVCEATVCPEEKVREQAFMCLVEIGALYYDKLAPYMQAIYGVTTDAVKKDSESVALQAIEFWSTLCDVEVDIINEIQEAVENEETPAVTCFNFVKTAAEHLIPMLLSTLTKQEEDQDEDTWNLATAAGTCLALVAQVIGDDIVARTMPFITTNINNSDWHFREAAILAFGSILEGPTVDTIKPLVDQAVPIMMPHMKDSITLVKDSTAWTLGRIAEIVPEPMIDKYLSPVLQAMVEALTDEPTVSSKACYVIHNIAEYFSDGYEATSPLAPFFQGLVHALFTAASREDGDEANLSSSAYEAINMLLQAAPSEVNPIVAAVVPHVASSLEKTFSQQALSSDEKDRQAIAQGHLCGALQSCIRKLGGDIRPHADRVMQLCLAVISQKRGAVLEESLMAIGALADAVEGDFLRYMDAFTPFFLQCLKNHEEDQVCSVAVGTVTDLATALGDKMLPYCDQIVAVLLENLQNPSLNRNVKANVIAAFGDIALAIGGQFERYLTHVMAVVAQAAQTRIDTDDEDLLDYLNMLRQNILECITGILQGIKDSKKEIFHPYIQGVCDLLGLVAGDRSKSTEVLRAAVGVVGDLANVYGATVKPLLVQDFIQKLVKDAAKSGDEDTKDSAKYAKNALKAL